MAAGYNHPKVKVHVGDGFKFLDDYKNSFDVIITDSSDPEGPAESLFQKPYFQLMHNALRDGGVITTQGCTFPLSFIPGKMLTQANSVPGPSQASCLDTQMRFQHHKQKNTSNCARPPPLPVPSPPPTACFNASYPSLYQLAHQPHVLKANLSQ